MFHIQNIIMSQCSKRRSNNEKAVIQKWFVIALQKTRDFSENNEEKKDERNTKEINWSDLSRNRNFANVMMMQRDLIVSLCKLESEDIALHMMSSKVQAVLEKFQIWVKRIASSAHVVRRSFAILAHDVHITLNTSNQKMIIKRLIKNNIRLHENLKMLRIAWFKKIVKSEKTYSSLIIKIAIKMMIN